MSRADEIAQGLRDESGALTFALVAEEYQQGHIDFEEGAPRPRDTTPSYDLGRARAAEKQAFRTEAKEAMRRDDLERRAVMRKMLADHPAALASWEAAMADIDTMFEQGCVP